MLATYFIEHKNFRKCFHGFAITNKDILGLRTRDIILARVDFTLL